jgi:hypothetical protein
MPANSCQVPNGPGAVNLFPTKLTDESNTEALEWPARRMVASMFGMASKDFKHSDADSEPSQTEINKEYMFSHAFPNSACAFLQLERQERPLVSSMQSPEANHTASRQNGYLTYRDEQISHTHILSAPPSAFIFCPRRPPQAPGLIAQTIPRHKHHHQTPSSPWAVPPSLRFPIPHTPPACLMKCTGKLSLPATLH